MTSPTFDPRAMRKRRGLPELLLIGVDHRSAPIELREKVSYGEDDGAALLERLVNRPEISEACLLSTCNRTEIYLRPADPLPAYGVGLKLAFLDKAPEVESEGRFYVKHNQEAARHLMEVASGLQSMVLGEPEILGQLKQASQRAEDLGAARGVLRQLLRGAIGAGGRARAETAIGDGSVSFGYAVVDLARNIFRQLDGCSALLIGAGETARQVGRSLCERGVHQLTVANRSFERAEKLCRELPGAQPIPFEERRQQLRFSDLVVATTGANEPIVSGEDFARAMRQRPSRPLLAVDLGVPRNIESESGKVENVFLQDVDSLEALIARNLKRRRSEIPRVQEILEGELTHFDTWCRGRAAEPLVRQLQQRAEQTRRQELEVAQRRLPAEHHEELDKLTRALVRKLLHYPCVELRRGDNDDERIEWARKLFRLEADEGET